MSRRNKLHIVPKGSVSITPERQERFKPDLSRVFIATADIPRETVKPRISPFVDDPFAHDNKHLALRVMRVRGRELAKPDEGQPASFSTVAIMGLTLITLTILVVWAIWGRG